MLAKGERVRVYRNLHKNLYSVQAKHRKPNGKRGWKVVEHYDSVAILSPRFTVSEQGRQRVLREKRKNVHAFVEGLFAAGDDPARMFFEDYEGGDWVQVSYNPYKTRTFVEYETGKPIHEAQICVLDDNFKMWVVR